MSRLLTKPCEILYKNKCIFERVYGNYALTIGNISGSRKFSLTSTKYLKEIQEKQEGNKTVIEGVKVKSEREGRVLPTPCASPRGCPLCPYRLGEKLDIHYTDVLVLSQFLRSDGCLLPRYVTGLCLSRQNEVKKLVAKAQRAGLMPELRPVIPGKERTNLRSNLRWRKYNTFFEEM